MKLHKETISMNEVYKRKCFICGAKRPLLRHHMVPKKEDKKSDKIIIICYNCHSHIHWLYKNFKRAEKVYKKYSELKDYEKVTW